MTWYAVFYDKYWAKWSLSAGLLREGILDEGPRPQLLHAAARVLALLPAAPLVLTSLVGHGVADARVLEPGSGS